MKKQSSGVIINAISFGAKIPSANVGFYSASKSALKTLTKCMAAEWAPYGIRVNGFSPGVIPTEMTETTIKKRKVELIHAISMQRLGKIQEVANAVLFLASQSSSYITGIDLEISGGKFLLQDPQTPWQESKR
jgi:NAD(P)-dependent dehydrogenase (short-subunit alcohol dehydrogenase family)